MSTFGTPPEKLEKARVYFHPGDYVMGNKIWTTKDKGDIVDGPNELELVVKKLNKQAEQVKHSKYTNGNGLVLVETGPSLWVHLELPSKETDKYEKDQRYVGVLSEFNANNPSDRKRHLWLLLEPVDYHRV